MAAPQQDHSTERFGFTVFLSACVHAMVILGVGFTYLEEFTHAPTMEITLAQYSSPSEPDEADFLAQENQTGSGTLDERAAPSSPFTSEFNADVMATAKRDLAEGETLDGEGGYCVYGRIAPAASSLAAGALPIGLAHHVRLTQPVAAGETVRWQDVEIDESRPAVQARRAMEQRFGRRA